MRGGSVPEVGSVAVATNARLDRVIELLQRIDATLVEIRDNDMSTAIYTELSGLKSTVELALEDR
jgi:hypothetical protein